MLIICRGRDLDIDKNTYDLANKGGTDNYCEYHGGFWGSELSFESDELLELREVNMGVATNKGGHSGAEAHEVDNVEGANL